MKHSTALILKGFIKEMLNDDTGWNREVIGAEAYQVFRLIENPEDIPEDKKNK